MPSLTYIFLGLIFNFFNLFLNNTILIKLFLNNKIFIILFLLYIIVKMLEKYKFDPTSEKVFGENIFKIFEDIVEE